MGTPAVPESVQRWPGEPPGVGEVPLPNGRERGRRPLRELRARREGQGTETGARPATPAHPVMPRPQPPAPTTYADISFIASCASLTGESFALGSCSCSSLLLLSTFLRSLVARLLAHCLTYYGRGIQPSSENTRKPALFMTIQRGRRQYGASSQPAPRPLRTRP